MEKKVIKVIKEGEKKEKGKQKKKKNKLLNQEKTKEE